MHTATERRKSTRIDKVFRVLVSTEESGDHWCVARNISSTGMFVEMPDPLPLNTKVIVRFSMPLSGDLEHAPPPSEDTSICAIARVQNHYYLQYSDGEGLRALSGVGFRFLRFLPEVGASPPREQLH